MKRYTIGLALLGLVAVACGTAPATDSGSTAETAAVETQSTPAPETVETPAVDETPSGDDGGSMETEETESTESTETPAESVVVAVPDGPAAPSVTLELSDGSTFVLADAQKPVMFVFWAEW